MGPVRRGAEETAARALAHGLGARLEVGVAARPDDGVDADTLLAGIGR